MFLSIQNMTHLDFYLNSLIEYRVYGLDNLIEINRDIHFTNLYRFEHPIVKGIQILA